MTGIVILNVVLVAIVVAGIVGLLTWSIVSSVNRVDAVRTHSHRMNRSYRMPEVRSDAAASRAPTHVFPLAGLDETGRAQQRQ